MTIATYHLEIGFQDGPSRDIGDTGTASGVRWTDISSAMLSFNTRTGRQHELDRTEAGTLTVMLDNRSRAFDPTYSLSPFTTGLTPLRPVRLKATVNGTSVYNIWTGYAEAWTQQYTLGGHPVVELRAGLFQKDQPLSETWVYRWTP